LILSDSVFTGVGIATFNMQYHCVLCHRWARSLGGTSI